MTYTIKGIRETGTITYHCSTTRSALEKMQDFHKAEYSNVSAFSQCGRAVSESRLIVLLGREAARV